MLSKLKGFIPLLVSRPQVADATAGRSRQGGRVTGFTLVEIVFVSILSSILLVVLLRFLVAGYPLYKVTYLQQRSTEAARLQLKRMAKVLREAKQADTGAYPLVAMDPQRIIIYSDVDADNTTERVRYELVGTNLERGVTEPSGDPLQYDVGTEQTTVVVSSVQNGATDLFTYYSGDYPADQTPLTPTDLTDVKYIEFHLIIDANPAIDPPAIDVVSQVQLRNLKTNLGETVE